MTRHAVETPDDPVRAYWAALPRRCRDALHRSDTVIAAVHTAVRDHHWTPKQLADESSRDLHDVINPGAVITDRLRKAAQHPPVGRPAHIPGPRLPFCSDDCRDNAGWRIDPDTGALLGKCPCRTATPQEASA